MEGELLEVLVHLEGKELLEVVALLEEKEHLEVQGLLEVLAVVAYKQPVTKSQIDAIRGIRSDRVLESLMRRELVEERGRSSGIGRPYLYGTTRRFLEIFGFESLDDLPLIEDIDSLTLDDEDFEEPMPDQLTIPGSDAV